MGIRLERLKSQIQDSQVNLAKAMHTYFIGPMEKGFEAAKLQAPPAHVVDGVDLRILPKFICYKAALMREKISLQFWLAILAGLLLVTFISSRIEVMRLHTKLRDKEYILAPGVQDFISVAPQSVPDSHIQNAAMEFLHDFGSYNAVDIEEQYQRLEENMSPDLKVQFELEAGPWKSKVKEENISQVLSISEREIKSNSEGYYQVTAIGKKETYVNSEHLGSVDVVIEMLLKLVPPKAGRRWYLEIAKLTTTEANSFRVKSGLKTGGGK